MRWSRQARQQEKVVALVDVALQRAGERGRHGGGRARSAPLLEAGVEVDRDARQLGDLLASQPGRPPSRARPQADVSGADRFSAAAEEVGQARSIDHAPIIRADDGGIQGEVVPGYARSGVTAFFAAPWRAN
jgi:hypothetical protein